MSCSWSWWKWQYLFLDLLFGLPFSLSNHASAGPFFIYMRTWSSRVFSGVKLAILPDGGLDLLLSLRSFARADFLPLSWRGPSCLSLFFGLPPWAIMASSAFMNFVALYNMSAIVFGSFLYGEKKLSGLESVGESHDQDLIFGFINQKSLFVESSHIWPQALILSLLDVQ